MLIDIAGFIHYIAKSRQIEIYSIFIREAILSVFFMFLG
jgi:hypothetical protein